MIKNYHNVVPHVNTIPVQVGFSLIQANDPESVKLFHKLNKRQIVTTPDAKDKQGEWSTISDHGNPNGKRWGLGFVSL